MLIAFVTGILYFTLAVNGLAASAGFALFTFGLPFASLSFSFATRAGPARVTLFMNLARGIGLVHGRLAKSLLVTE